MAAYAATVTSLMKAPLKVNDVVGLVAFAGKVNVTNYNPTLGAITDISGKFKSIIAVVAGPSDAGYFFEWVAASNSFKAYYFDYDAIADGAAIEAVVDTDVGEAQFIALGIR